MSKVKELLLAAGGMGAISRLIDRLPNLREMMDSLGLTEEQQRETLDYVHSVLKDTTEDYHQHLLEKLSGELTEEQAGRVLDFWASDDMKKVSQVLDKVGELMEPFLAYATGKINDFQKEKWIQFRQENRELDQ